MRTKNSIKNIYSGILAQIIILLLNLISRKILLVKMGVVILGLIGVFTNVISMLSLVECGIGLSISYSLYKPLAENNVSQIRAIMNLYSKLYKIIGFLVLIIGLILMAFVNKFAKTDLPIRYVQILFLLFVIDSCVTYFLSYRKIILIADQKNFIVSKINLVYVIITNIVQIIVVMYIKNLILFLIVKIIVNILQNINIYGITNKEYSYLIKKSDVKLDDNIKKEIIKNIKALSLANVSVYLIFGTDNLLLSTFVGVTAVGIFSGYTMIINGVKMLMSQVFLGITPSYGNLLVNKSIKEAHDIYMVLYFLNFCICTVFSACLLILIDPFIKIWLGIQMILPFMSVILIILNFYSDMMRSSIELVKSASGMYSPYPFFKYWIVIEGVTNIILALVLCGYFKIGLNGILIATSISSMIPTYILPFNIYKYVFKKSSKIYYYKHLLYTTISFITVVISYMVISKIYLQNEYILFIIKLFLALILPSLLIILLFFKSSEFKYLYKKILRRVD